MYTVQQEGAKYHAETGRDGTYRLTDRPLGTYDVYAERKRGKQVRQSDHVQTATETPGQEVTVDLSF